MFENIIGSIFWLIVALGLLITFHEFGHFWVARRCGVRVLRFSVGFGRPLWSRRDRHGTEFAIAAIPLGGYVKMLDERETAVPDASRPEAFNTKPVAQRMAITAAGPAANLVFAVAAFWLMFVVGVPERRPLLDEPAGIAAQAGLQAEDLIVAVNGRPVETWTHTLLALIPPALDRKVVELTVSDAAGDRRSVTLPLNRLGDSFSEENALQGIGLTPWQPELPAVVGEATAGDPAAAAGLRAGDRLIAIGSEPVSDWRDIGTRIQTADPGPVEITYERDGRRDTLSIEPRAEGERRVIGITPPAWPESERATWERTATVLRHGPVNAVGAAFTETWRLTTGSLGILARMVTGQASLSNISGPITIARMANQSAALGVSRFLFFLGLISLSLAIINLLPIPMLDGGHLMYYLVECFKGSPVSEQTQIIGQYIGLMVVVTLMGLAIFNDILRLFP